MVPFCLVRALEFCHAEIRRGHLPGTCTNTARVPLRQLPHARYEGPAKGP